MSGQTVRPHPCAALPIDSVSWVACSARQASQSDRPEVTRTQRFSLPAQAERTRGESVETVRAWRRWSVCASRGHQGTRRTFVGVLLLRWSSSRESSRCGSRGGAGDPCICVCCESGGSARHHRKAQARALPQVRISALETGNWQLETERGSGTRVGRCVRVVRFLVILSFVGGLDDFG